jgi:hypothetical protein
MTAVAVRETVVESRRPFAAPEIDPHPYQAFRLLQLGFVVAPIVAGLDKFFDLLVNWPMYLSPLVPRLLGVAAPTFMKGVGVVEMVAGLLVAMKPKVGGYVVGLWLLGIIVNLLTIPGFYDIALRDLGLAIGAFALARLAHTFDRRPAA